MCEASETNCCTTSFTNMTKHLLIPVLIFISTVVYSQPVSVHQEQAEFYKNLANKTQAQYDSLNCFAGRTPHGRSDASLLKRVFGYHPYWIGNAWQNYRWELLSDLCYFSYDADPATGNPITTNDFETAPVIDTALAHGVKVHLCVTLFSGHAVFFANPQAQQTLIGNLLALVQQRGIQGINIDFEAVPSSQKQGLTDFLLQLSVALHSNLPGAELSIAAPAVNWSNTFDIPAITPALDLVMVMAYDYYWGGSSLAGPVSGYWPLTSSFDYSVSKSLGYYQSQGVPNEKLLLGLPYYGREWPVASNTLPASTTGSGTAVTWRNVRGNSSGFYTPANLYWDPRSYNPYYSYFNNNWRQCFYDDTRSLGAKYDFVNRRNTGGIGIWALGYDNGYPELWELIEAKFTNSPLQLCRDTLHDSGGPWWNYADNECYTETIVTESAGPLRLNFEQFSFESGFDTLWIYDGSSVNSPLLAALSGDLAPAEFVTSGSAFTLRFHSDGATTRAGYSLVWSCPTAAVEQMPFPEIMVYPNPGRNSLNIEFSDISSKQWAVSLTDTQGKLVLDEMILVRELAVLDVSKVKPGIYLLKLISGNTIVSRKVVIQ